MSEFQDPWNGDDEFWHRLVDGELSRQELRQFLQACDREPELWQRCAMSFLEEQAFEQEFASLSDDASLWQSPQATSAPDLAERHLPIAADNSGHASTSGAGPMGWMNFLSMAAMVLIAFGIGWQASKRAGGFQTGVEQLPSVAAHRNSYDTSQTSQTVSMPANKDLLATQNAQRRMADVSSDGTPSRLASPNMLVAETPIGDSENAQIQQQLPNALRKLSNLEVGRSYGVVPVNLNGVPAWVPLEKLDFRTRDAY